MELRPNVLRDVSLWSNVYGCDQNAWGQAAFEGSSTQTVFNNLLPKYKTYSTFGQRYRQRVQYLFFLFSLTTRPKRELFLQIGLQERGYSDLSYTSPDTQNGRYMWVLCWRLQIFCYRPILGLDLSLETALSWLAFHGRCWMLDRRRRHGLQESGICILCDQESETIDHLLLGCLQQGGLGVDFHAPSA